MKYFRTVGRLSIVLIVLLPLAWQGVQAQSSRHAALRHDVQRVVRASNALQSDKTSELITLRQFDPDSNQVVFVVDFVAPLDSGFVFGTNHFGDLAKATAFTLPDGVTEAQVTEVNVWFGFKRDSLTTQTYAIEIYEGTASSGPTGAPRYSESFLLSDIMADAVIETADPATVHTLTSPVTVGPSFFVSVAFGSYGQSDWGNAAIVSSDFLGQRIENVWEHWSSDNAWHNVSEAWFEEGNDGWQPWIEAIVETSVGTATDPGEEELPQVFMLAQNYPNPFNPETRIDYALPNAASVHLDIFNVLGQQVRTLVQTEQAAGSHSVVWDGQTDAGATAPTGLYIYRLDAGTFTTAKTMVLLR